MATDTNGAAASAPASAAQSPQAVSDKDKAALTGATASMRDKIGYMFGDFGNDFFLCLSARS